MGPRELRFHSLVPHHGRILRPSVTIPGCISLCSAPREYVTGLSSSRRVAACHTKVSSFIHTLLSRSFAPCYSQARRHVAFRGESAVAPGRRIRSRRAARLAGHGGGISEASRQSLPTRRCGCVPPEAPAASPVNAMVSDRYDSSEAYVVVEPPLDNLRCTLDRFTHGYGLKLPILHTDHALRNTERLLSVQLGFLWRQRCKEYREGQANARGGEMTFSSGTSPRSIMSRDVAHLAMQTHGIRERLKGRFRVIRSRAEYILS